MKTFITILGGLIMLSACRREDDLLPLPKASSTKATTTDTIPDSATFKVKLSSDSINSDETLIYFNHKAHTTFQISEDAPYFQGFGQVSLASISSDGDDLAINQLPYKKEMSIWLNVRTRLDGIFNLGISYKNKIPAFTQIWLMDTYEKDSVNLCEKPFSFQVERADTNSFGSKRFKLVLRSNAHS